jgi:universal stress protein A
MNQAREFNIGRLLFVSLATKRTKESRFKPPTKSCYRYRSEQLQNPKCIGLFWYNEKIQHTTLIVKSDLTPITSTLRAALGTSPPIGNLYYRDHMANYQHILLAADFSEEGDFVAHRARLMANLHRAKLSIVHVLDNIPMPDTGYGTLIPLDQTTDYRLLEAEKLKLIRLAERLQVEPGDRWLIWGTPTEEIVRLAEQQAADLIVIGSHGRHGLAMLLGSTANGVLHGTHSDLLAVRLP